MTNAIVPKDRCIYGWCRARNLCKGEHCVGARLLVKDGYVIEGGAMRDATEEERERFTKHIRQPEGA
jgi:hypothetical protein